MTMINSGSKGLKVVEYKYRVFARCAFVVPITKYKFANVVGYNYQVQVYNMAQ